MIAVIIIFSFIPIGIILSNKYEKYREEKILEERRNNEIKVLTSKIIDKTNSISLKFILIIFIALSAI